MAIIASLVLAVLFFITLGLFNTGKLLSLFITVGALILIFGFIKVWRNRRDKNVEDALYAMFNDREYQIEKELAVTALRLKEEEDQLVEVEAQIEKLKKVCEENQTNFITNQEQASITENLEHLAIRRELRQAKVAFFENYLKKWRIRRALHDSEDLLISEVQQEKGTSSRAVLHMQAQQQNQMNDIMSLRPLSERMDLCDSREEAELLLEELRVLNV